MQIVNNEGITFDDVLLYPQYSDISSRSEVDLSTHITAGQELSTPIVSANMDTITEYEMAKRMWDIGGLGIVHRFLKPADKQAEIIRKLRDSYSCAAGAIGINSHNNGRLKKLVDAGASIICLDVAHSDNVLTYKMLNHIEKTYGVKKPFQLIVGNVGTFESANMLLTENGGIIDAIKVGIGPGSLCSTRVVTGHGIPQLTAISQVREALDMFNDLFEGDSVRLIADGGIRNSGDIVKALAAGADSIMIGGLFAGCDETPGSIITMNERRCKVYRGMASYDAMADIGRDDRAPEGFSAIVPCNGPVGDIMKDLIGGIKSGLSYTGAKNLEQFRERARFIRVTPATVAENHPHLFGRLK